MLIQKSIEGLLKLQQKQFRVDENYDVRAYLNRIPEYFDPAKAPEGRQLTVVYEFHDSDKNNGTWTVAVADGKCTLTEGEAESFDTKLYMTAETYRRILTGLLEIGMLAYGTGAVRFFGNSLGLRELNSYLTIPKKACIAKL